MSPPRFVVERRLKANDRGLGKYHLAQAGDQRTLCSVTLRHGRASQAGRPIESTLRSLERVSERQKKGSACKNCISRAQKLRNPLDRLTEV